MIRFASSLRARLIAFVLLAVLPAFGVILFTDQRHRATIADQVQNSALGSARVIATEQRRIFENAHQLLITLARLPQLREGNAAACEKILAGLLEPLYVDFGLVDVKGNLLCNALGSHIFHSRRLRNSYVGRVVESRDITIGEIQRDAANGKSVIELGFPIGESTGSLRAIAFVVLDYSWIVRITVKKQLPSGASFTLFDGNGKVFLRYPDGPGAQFATPIQTDSAGKTKPIRGVEGNIESTGLDRIAHLFTYRQLDHRIGGSVMYAGIAVPARAAFAESENILRENLIILSVLTALTLIAAWFGADLFVLRRVSDLVDATKELAGGNLKARTGLPYGGSELGHLARTFDDLAKTLDQRAADAKVAETEIQKQHLRQSAIHEISTAMTSSLDVGNVLTALSEGVTPLFPSSCVSIRWLDEQSGRIEPIAQSLRTGHMGQLGGAESESGFPFEVFKLKSPLLISNAQSDPRASDPKSLRAAGFVTYLGLPMIVKGEVLGVLSFYSTETTDLRIEDTFLADLTQQAAIALYNSHLFEQTRNQTVELEKSNRIKDEFLGVISHELRTPLNIIMNCAEALNMGIFGDITQEHAKGTEKIRVQASHLLSLINSILEITKIESGRMAINAEPINLDELIRDLESDYAMTSKEKNLAINWRIPADLPNFVTDRMKLRQVAINLVNNAIKFTDQGSVDISFRSVPNEPFIEFSVSDTGIGMAEEFLPHIFDKFNQIDNATTRNYSGAGLGLYLVKNFVGLLGGSVSVYSRLGEGTTFSVRLPINLSSDVHDDDRLAGNESTSVVAPRPAMEVEL